MQPYELLVWAHRLTGYPTAFAIAPIALLAWKGGSTHRRWGKRYFLAMCFLYLSGTVVTFEKHELLSWKFLRNISFNGFGFWMVALAVRAAWLMGRPPARPAALDRALAALITLGAIGMLCTAPRDLPMLVIGALGVVLCAVEWRELNAGFETKAMLLARHIRYMLISFFYLITVLSIVHVKWSHAKIWLWPSVILLPLLFLTSRRGQAWIGISTGRALNIAARVSVAVAWLMLLYIVGRGVKKGPAALGLPDF